MTETSLTFRKLRHAAKESAADFLELANDSAKGGEAMDWALAAKNAISVAVSCETILKIQKGGGR